jgi:hypothetical protein
VNVHGVAIDFTLCDPWGMAKIVSSELPISQMTLVCPLCSAKPDKFCETASGIHLEIRHVARN